MDAQSEAFRLAPPRDLVIGEQLDLMFDTGELVGVPIDRPIVPPERWHARGWDEGREPPKTAVEAQRALFSRVVDPTAPDVTVYEYGP